MCIYMYIYMYTHMCIYIYIYIYRIWRIYMYMYYMEDLIIIEPELW